MVEIVTDKNRKPNPLWLSFVKTQKAKTSIRAAIRFEDKDLHRERGRNILNGYLEKSGLSPLDKDLTQLKSLDDRIYGVEERYNILEQVGNFSIAPSSLLRKIMRNKNLIVRRTPIGKDEFPVQKVVADENPDEKIIYIG